MYDVMSAGYFFEGKTHFYTISVFASVTCNIVVNYFLIPIMGIWACGIAFVVSNALFAYLSHYFGRKYFAVPYEWGRMGKVALLGLLFAFAALFIRQLNLTMGISLGAISLVLLAMLLYKLMEQSEVQIFKNLLNLRTNK
jgi:O-antigen/teichoic acid export membrane protein